MTNANDYFLFEYIYIPCPDAEERFAQALDIIVALILEEYENEIREADCAGGEAC